MRRSALFLRLAVLLAGVAAWQVAPALADGPTPQDDLVGFDPQLNAQVPLDLTFTDEHGRPVQLADYVGEKPVILSLNYYHCPNFCLLALDSLAERLERFDLALGKDFRVVTVSIDPTETPAQALERKDLLLRHHQLPAADDWHFLTGQPEQIQALAQVVGFRYLFDPLHNEFNHPAGVMVLTPGGQVARYLYGITFLARDLRLALVEAAQGRIGSPVDQVMLRCYRYDPATGQYNLAATNVLKLAGLATVLWLGVFLYALWRPELRRLRAGAKG